MKRNLGLKYFLQVKRGYLKNKAIALRGELNRGRPRKNIDLERALKESFCFFSSGKKGNSNRLELDSLIKFSVS